MLTEKQLKEPVISINMLDFFIYNQCEEAMKIILPNVVEFLKSGTVITLRNDTDMLSQPLFSIEIVELFIKNNDCGALLSAPPVIAGFFKSILFIKDFDTVMGNFNILKETLKVTLSVYFNEDDVGNIMASLMKAIRVMPWGVI